MRPLKSAIPPKASLPLALHLAPQSGVRRGSVATSDLGPDAPLREILLPLIIESTDERGLEHALGELERDESLVPLGEGFHSGSLRLSRTRNLLRPPEAVAVKRIHLQTPSEPCLGAILPEIGLFAAPERCRCVPEDGRGVLIGVIDSGFDLSHPAFREPGSGRLRVAALLDQVDGGSPYETAQLQTFWESGQRLGYDSHGHGTHVASIAGGSRHWDHEGVAPGATLLLVRTDFLRTQEAVAWVFNKAEQLGQPCVVNLSLGNHWGAHDGTGVEERFHLARTKPGRILVVAAGNERESALHLGGWFHKGLEHEVTFDVKRAAKDPAQVALNVWYHPDDQFEGAVMAPDGTLYQWPTIGAEEAHSRWLGSDIVIGRGRDEDNDWVQVAIELRMPASVVESTELEGWRLRVNCRHAALGRVDAWISQKSCGRFRDHHLVDPYGTVSMPATGPGCIAVASHVCRSTWECNGDQIQEDVRAIVGRTSVFSGMGPTRNGRWKPDISAPGQYVTAALASGSSLSDSLERTLPQKSLVTLCGTSMAAPVVTGVIALMLQKKPKLTLEEARTILRETARKDDHSQGAPWNPAYGYGKIDAAAALARL